MLKRKSFFVSATAFFVVAETFLGIMIHTSVNRLINLFQFSSIILAALFLLIFSERTASFFLTQSALIFTVFADYFLVWSMPQLKLNGMIFFLFAQMFYATRLYTSTESKVSRRLQHALRGSLTVAILIITMQVLGDNTDALSLVSMAYYVNIFLNLIFSFIEFKKHYLLAIGFTFFILCDTIIGLTALKQYLPFGAYEFIYPIIYPGFDLSWVFYLPSQMLIAISLLPHKLKSLKSDSCADA